METWAPIIAATVAAILASTVALIKDVGSLRTIEDIQNAIKHLTESNSIYRTLLIEKLEWNIENRVRIHCDRKTKTILRVAYVLLVVTIAYMIIYTASTFLMWNLSFVLAVQIIFPLILLFTFIILMLAFRRKKLSNKQEEILESLLNPILHQGYTLQKAIESLLDSAESHNEKETILAGIISLANEKYIIGMRYASLPEKQACIITRHGYLDDEALYYFGNNNKKMKQLTKEMGAKRSLSK